MPLASSCSWPSTVTLSGTSRSFSLRRVAVTTMASSSWAPPGWDRDSSAWPVACARAETGKASNVATYADATRRLAMRIPSQGLPVKHESVPGYCKAETALSTLTHGCVNIFSGPETAFGSGACCCTATIRRRPVAPAQARPVRTHAYGMAHGIAAVHAGDARTERRPCRRHEGCASAEDDGLVAVEQDAVLDVAAHRTCQHLRFDVAADADQVARGHGVVHPGHVLLDDRALVQVRGHVVRGGADDLDPARVRLVVGLGALEAGQEAVVDVDRAPGQRLAHARREDLHVARQHHQVDPFALDQVQDRLLLPRAVAVVHRQVVERHAVGGGERGEVGVVG